MSHVPTRSKFQNVQFAYIKSGNSRDVSEGLDDTIVLIIDDAGAPVLHMASVSHLVSASSHSLRGVEFFDIIPGLQFLQTQNSLLGLLVVFNFIFHHQRKFKNFLNTMNFRYRKAKAAKVEQTAYLFCIVFTLRCQWRQVLVGTNMRPA